MRTHCCLPTFGSPQCNDCPLTVPTYRPGARFITTTVNFSNHEPGCPRMTAAGDPPCICGARAAFERYGGPGVDPLMWGPFLAGWTAARQPIAGISTVTGGHFGHAQCNEQEKP